MWYQRDRCLPLNSPRVDQAEPLRSREAQFSRGPDGSGLWIDRDQTIGLAILHHQIDNQDSFAVHEAPFVITIDTESRPDMIAIATILNRRQQQTPLAKKQHR